MILLLEFLKYFGFNITLPEIDSPVFNLYVIGLSLSLISLLCIINLIIYLLVIYFSDNIKIINFVNKYKLLYKLFTIYKNTRVYYIIFEFILLLSCNILFLICFSMLIYNFK